MNAPKYEPICGFDVGSENCFIGQVDLKGFKFILNEYNLVSTPSYLCYHNEKREIGIEAKTNIKNVGNKVFNNFKRLIGKEYEEVKNDELLFFFIKKGPNGELLIPIKIFDKEYLLTPTQLLAMVLSELKRLSGAKECVINCPNYFDDCQRRELINAASIANLKVLQLIPDTTAIALHLCCQKTGPLSINDEYAAFVDIGTNSLQCSIIKYNEEKKFFKVQMVDFDDSLGGNNFTEVLFNYFIEEYKLDLNKSTKSILWSECEALKIRMSSHDCNSLFKIKNFNENKELCISINRSKYIELCKSLLERIETVLNRALTDFKNLYKNDLRPNFKIVNVGLTGGSTQIREIINKVKKVFGVKVFLPLDLFYNVIHGSTLKCFYFNKEIIANYKVEYKDYQPYQINVSYFHKKSLELKKYSINPLFKKGCSIPSTTQIKLSCHELPVVFNFGYVDDENKAKELGKFEVYSKENFNFEKSKMLVKVRLDESGLLQFLSAQLEIKEENKEKSQNIEDKKTRLVNLEHKIISLKGFLTNESLEKLKKFESDLIDKVPAEEMYSRNELVQFVHLWTKRIKLEEYYRYLSLESRKNFIKELKDAEKHALRVLDFRGKSFYQKKLDLLKVYADKITDGIYELDFKKDMFSIISTKSHLLKTFDKSIDIHFLKFLCKEIKDFIAQTQDWIDQCLPKSMKNEFEEDPKYSYSVCQQKLNELKDVFKNIESNGNSKNN